MTVKELKKRLESAPDDAVVLLYDDLNEGDVFCTTTASTTKEHYTGYCQAYSMTDGIPDNTKLFVLAGNGMCFEDIDNYVDNLLCHIVNSTASGNDA